MLGGYQIIDLKGQDISVEGGITVKDVFKKVATGKAILVENLNVDGDIIGGAFGYAMKSGNNYGVSVASLTLIVTPDDNISVSA